jgi:hypothetical protein
MIDVDTGEDLWGIINRDVDDDKQGQYVSDYKSRVVKYINAYDHDILNTLKDKIIIDLERIEDQDKLKTVVNNAYNIMNIT